MEGQRYQSHWTEPEASLSRSGLAGGLGRRWGRSSSMSCEVVEISRKCEQRRRLEVGLMMSCVPVRALVERSSRYLPEQFRVAEVQGERESFETSSGRPRFLFMVEIWLVVLGTDAVQGWSTLNEITE